MTRRLAAGIYIGLAVVIFAQLVPGQENSGSVSGVVRNASRQPVAGAMIQVRNNELGVTFAVTSRDQGVYKVINLPSGKYQIQASGGGFQSEPQQNVEVRTGQAVTTDVNLSMPQSIQRGMTSSLFAQLIPDDELRTTIIRKCSDCHHSAERILPLRRNRADWKAVVETMCNYPYVHLLKEPNIDRNLQLTEKQRDEIADLLAKDLGPGAPPLDGRPLLDKVWAPPEAAKAFVVEYDVPVESQPHDVTVDPQGIAWVNETRTGYIGHIDPVFHKYTRIELPRDQKQTPPNPNAILSDSSGRLWFEDHHDGGTLARYDPKTKEYLFYPIPLASHGARSTAVNGIRVDTDGTVWAANNGGDRILHLNPATKKYSEYLVPSTSSEMYGAVPYSLGIDGTHNVWFTERNREKQHVDKIGEVNVASGKVAEYELPTRGAVLRRMSSGDANGNIWFGEMGGVGKLAMVDYRTKRISEYPTPTKYSGPYSVSVDLKHNFIWFSEVLADKIGRFDPRTHTFVEYPLPTHYQSIRRVEVDPNRPNRVWYSGYNSSKVGYIEVQE